MASAQKVKPDGVVYAIQILHSLLPLIVAAYFAISYLVSVVRKNDQNRKPQRTSIQNIASWMVFTVLITYCLDSAILIYTSFFDDDPMVPQDHIVFSLSSILLWTAMFLVFVDCAQTACYLFYGPWVAYMATETILLGLSSHAGLKNQPWMPLTGIQILRICILFMLVCSFSIYPTRKTRVHSDEENTPLLVTENANSNGVDSPQGCTSVNGYATINREEEDILSTLQDGKEKQKKPSILEDFLFLLPFFWPKGRPHLQLLYVGVGLCLLVDRVLNVLVPLQLGLITNILSKQSGMLPWKEIMIFAILRFFDSSGGVSAIRRYLWQPLENFTYHEISTAAFNQIMTLSSDFHDNKHSGSLWQSVSRGTSIRHSVDSILFQIGPMLVDLVLAVSVLYYLFDAYVALITAAVFIFYLWSSSKILAKQKDKRRQLISALEKEYNVLCESTSNWKTVSYFNRVDYEKNHYSSAVKSHMASSLTFMLWSNLESVAQSFLLICGLTGACFLAAYQVVQGHKPVGSFVMLLSYWTQLSGPLRFFAHGFCDFALDMVNVEELINLLRQKPTVCDQPGAKQLVFYQGKIQFHDVSFSYDGRRKVLKDISFHVRPGQTVALVGETGGGKSTILKLISRFYDPRSGSVIIDGQNVRDVTLESLRANIGIVPQDPALFHDTIINNIKYANPSATDEEVYEACKAVALHDKFLTFIDGYKTLVGERGVKLSGGELQRVAIARAIVRNPNIVLLDEATSSVDSNTELQIQNSLRKLTAGRTTLIIAHRLSTIVNADKILVIDDGQIVEEGTHEELLKSKGYYHHLWSHQSSPKSEGQKGQGANLQFIGAPPSTKGNSAQYAGGSEADNGTEGSHVTSVRSTTEPIDDDLISVLEEDTAVADLVPEVSTDNLLSIDKDNSRISSLKPDAPEFIPQGLQHSKKAASPAVNEDNTVVKSTKGIDLTNHIGKENYREAKTHAGHYHGLDTNVQISQTSHTASKRNGTKGTTSFAAQDEVGTVLSLRQVVNSNAVNADISSNKTHKHRKKIVSRRRLSKSEPSSFK